jgi:transposase
VPVKSAGQQAVLMLHRTRVLLIRQQTLLANAFRAHLAEFGIVVVQGIRHVRELIERVFAEDIFARIRRMTHKYVEGQVRFSYDNQ